MRVEIAQVAGVTKRHDVAVFWENVAVLCLNPDLAGAVRRNQKAAQSNRDAHMRALRKAETPPGLTYAILFRFFRASRVPLAYRLVPANNRRPVTRRNFVKACGIAGGGIVASRTWSAEQWQSLFDGKSLKGWHKPPKRIGHGTGGHWVVEDGILFGEQDPPGSGNGGILLTDEKVGDFELQIEMRPDWRPDTGVFFRCTDQGDGVQMYVDYHEDGNVGHLRGEMPGAFAMKPFQLHGEYDEGGQLKGFTTTVDPRAKKWPKGVYEYSCTPEEFIKAWRLNDWNSARVRCVGKYPQITTWVNDLKVCHWNGETCPLPEYDKERVFKILGREGSIGLQIHGGKGWPAGAKCRWRNIRVRRL